MAGLENEAQAIDELEHLAELEKKKRKRAPRKKPSTALVPYKAPKPPARIPRTSRPKAASVPKGLEWTVPSRPRTSTSPKKTWQQEQAEMLAAFTARYNAEAIAVNRNPPGSRAFTRAYDELHRRWQIEPPYGQAQTQAGIRKTVAREWDHLHHNPTRIRG